MQWQLIGRVDNMQKTKVSNLGFNPDAPQGLQVRLTWSKNIREERAAPDQVVFGSGDGRICALLHLACHLESSFVTGVTRSNSFLFGDGGTWTQW